MNVVIQNPASAMPSARDLMERALDRHMLLGMPHLTPHGLSETWLMKELGHRHWMMLARRLGMDNADFRTADGHEVYASICATSLRDARFHLAKANDVIEFKSMLTPLSANRHSSRHRIVTDRHVICDVELLSVFVKRECGSDNHSLARIDHVKDIDVIPQTSAFSQLATAVRRHQVPTHLGMRLNGEGRALMTFTPDVADDFNGAGLLYFARYQAFLSRAAAALMSPPPGQPMRRDVFFSGNVRPGEKIQISLLDRSPDGDRLSCKMTREDGKVIACAVVAC